MGGFFRKLFILIIRRGKEDENLKEPIFDYLSGVFNGDITKIEQYTDTDSNPEIRKEVSEMSEIGEYIAINAAINADMKSLRKGVEAGIIKNPHDATIMFPNLEKEDIQTIFDAILNTNKE